LRPSQLITLESAVPGIELWTKGTAAYDLVNKLVVSKRTIVRLIPWSIPDPVVRSKNKEDSKVTMQEYHLCGQQSDHDIINIFANARSQDFFLLLDEEDFETGEVLISCWRHTGIS